MKRIAILLLCSYLAFSGDADAASAVEETVKSLGPKTTKHDLAVLRTDPVKSVHLLADQLRTIPERKILNADQNTRPDEMRIVWTIRALRYLTGVDFKAKTRHPFKGQEDEHRKQFLRISSDGEVSFFGVWMSRDTIYIAPKDAQKEIIQKWKSWVDTKADRHQYDEPPVVDKWYF